MIVCLWWCST